MSNRDVLSPKEVAERTGYSYHAVLRAIRRGDLKATEPVRGRLRIRIEDYERWLETPARASTSERTGPRAVAATAGQPARTVRRRGDRPGDRGSLARLEAIEGGAA